MSYKITIHNKSTSSKPVIYEFVNVPEGLTGKVNYYTSGNRKCTLADFVNGTIKYPDDSLLLKNIKSDFSKDFVCPTGTSTFIVYYLGDGETFKYTAKATVNGAEYEIAPVSYHFDNGNGSVNDGVFRYALHYNNFIIMDFDKDIGSVRSAREDYRVKITNCDFLTHIQPKEVAPTYSLNFEATDNITVNPTKLTSAGDVVITPNDGYVFDSTAVHIGMLDDSGFSTGDSFTGYTTKGDVSRLTLSFDSSLFDGDYNLKIDSPVAVKKPSPTYTFTFKTLENVVATPTSLSAAGDVVLTPKVGYAFDDTGVLIKALDSKGAVIGTFSGYTVTGTVSQLTLSFGEGLFDDNYTLDIVKPTVSVIKTGVTVPIKKEATHCSISGASQLTEGVEATFTGVPETGYVIESIIVYADSDVIANTRNNTLSFVPTGLDTNKTYKVVASAVVVSQEPPAPDNVYLLNNIWLLNNDGVEELTKPYFTRNGTTLIAIPLSDYCSVLCRIPFLITPDDEKVFKLGDATSTIKQWYTNKSIHTFDFGSINVEEKFKNYTAYEPYVMYNLWLPMLGYQNINSEDIVGHTVSVKLIYNVYTNMGSYVVSNENNIIATFGVRVAEDLPLINRTADGLTQTMLASQLTENMDAFFIEKDYGATDLSNEGAVDGHVVNEVSQVKDHNGYLKCEAVDLNGLSTYSIMAEEINRLLLSGIIV